MGQVSVDIRGEEERRIAALADEGADGLINGEAIHHLHHKCIW